MDKDQKVQFVAAVREQLKSSKAIIIAHYHGLTVEDATSLRKDVREVGAQYKVVKNSLMKLAIVGTEFEGVTEFLAGPTAIAFSEDPVSIAKVFVKFAKKKEHLKILGGVVEKQVLDMNDVHNLSKMLSLDELRGKIVGIINTPARNIVGMLQAPACQVARVLGAYAAKG